MPTSVGHRGGGQTIRGHHSPDGADNRTMVSPQSSVEGWNPGLPRGGRFVKLSKVSPEFPADALTA
jgi:hypothetical protein